MRKITDLFDSYEEPEDRTGAPFVSESNQQLSLHFELAGIQSAMDLREPTRLALGYTRTMMSVLLYQPAPRHIGMIGLGGGSLAKYCYRHLPKTRITVAEISPEVIDLRDRFLIPRDDGRFQVLCESGAAFVQRHSAEFDVLIVDGFDSTGQPRELCSQEFYSSCRLALKRSGTLVVNICESGRSMLVARLRKAFSGRIVVTSAEDSNNTIVFAGHVHACPKAASLL